MEIVSLGAIAIGLINVGSADAEASSTLLQRLIELTPQKLSSTYSRLKTEVYPLNTFHDYAGGFVWPCFCRFLPLALGMIYMGCRDIIDAPSAALEVLPDPYKPAAQTMLEAMLSSLTKCSMIQSWINIIILRIRKYFIGLRCVHMPVQEMYWSFKGYCEFVRNRRTVKAFPSPRLTVLRAAAAISGLESSNFLRREQKRN